MKHHFHGAPQTVTGSKHLLEVNGHKLLLDCGLFQGRRKESYQRNLSFPFDPKSVDAVVLSHAHIDHSGNLPGLVKEGFSGPIFTTRASANLSRIMLADSGHIHESDVNFINKKRIKRGQPPAEPLYTVADAEEVAQYLRPVSYDEPFEPVPGVRARLVDAGHILGSAAASLEMEENGRQVRLWFSGDIGRRDLPLIRDPVFPARADYMIMECTYGDREHGTPEQAFEALRDIVVRTVNRGGKVIIPAFAVGRTQELVYCMHRMIDSGDIPRVPVFVDSPLAVNVTDIFRAHRDFFDAETWQFIEDDTRHNAALGFDLLTYVRSVEESKALNRRKDPMVIISASGMAETGRILHHLRHNIEDSRNTILIVSWQAPHTLGRRLVEGQTRVKIFGEVFKRKAEVETLNGLSAHAGQSLLVEYALKVKGQARNIFLVHGEQGPASALREKLTDWGMDGVVYPEMNAGFDL
ncbi:MAG: MBL fold metallo-hydrolase [Anaerolineales bacterium]|nr:MBL fold metallo-hydrolase [Anaerolineales bacterium]